VGGNVGIFGTEIIDDRNRRGVVGVVWSGMLGIER